MRNFSDWFQEAAIKADEPWLILGKGPSFTERKNYDLSQFKLLSLNHAVREQKVKVAHMIDFDVFEACAEAIEANAEVLVLPWIPHVKNQPGLLNLAELLNKDERLQKLNAENRLLWYNLSTAGNRYRAGAPVIEACFFSVEAALNLLAECGVRTIRSLGIDGGASYSNEFEDLRKKTLLANGHRSFDKQFQRIAKTLTNWHLDFAPLNQPSPIRVYVGTTEDQMLSVKVLEYSILKNTSMPVQVFPMHLAPIPVPKPQAPENQPRTPFSFQRFLIPALAGYGGRAIYVDSDMQVFRDLRELWSLPFQGADLLAAREPGSTGRRPQFSVMLLNCDLLKWKIEELVASLDDGELTYKQLMYEMSPAKHIRADIDPRWNSLERYEEGQTALLHYTDMPTQPWVSIDNPYEHLWMRDLFEGLDRGLIEFSLIQEHVEKGYIRPSMLEQVERRLERGVLLPSKILALDSKFKAPYRSLPNQGKPPLKVSLLAPAKRLSAKIEHFYQQTPLYKLQRKLQNR